MLAAAITTNKQKAQPKGIQKTPSTARSSLRRESTAPRQQRGCLALDRIPTKPERGIHWDEKRQRFIASVTVGYGPDGKCIVRRASGKTEAQARAKLKEVMRDHEDGLAIAPPNLAIAPRSLTVAHIVTDWLEYEFNGRSKKPSTTAPSFAGHTSSGRWEHGSCATGPPPTLTGG